MDFVNSFRECYYFAEVQDFYPDTPNIHVYIPTKVYYSCRYKYIKQSKDKDDMIMILLSSS